MRVKVFYHDFCFDGTCSAAVFSRFYQMAVNPEAEFEYVGLTHRPGSLFGETNFNADEHAILDFKYNPDSRVTWWFDHHQSGFLTVIDEAHFRADVSGKKFFDPTYKSCTKFIADVARERFGVDMPDLGELIAWADLIDGAQYADADTAVSLASPATQLALVIESGRDEALRHHIIRSLQNKTLAETVADPRVQATFAPLLARHERAIEIIRATGECADGVVYFDVSEYDIEGYNKFIAYWLYPDARYSVSLSRGASRSKVSIGYNPWSGRARTHNIASLCERYGGGGHPVVGAISYAPSELERARRVALEIVSELRTT